MILSVYKLTLDEMSVDKTGCYQKIFFKQRIGSRRTLYVFKNPICQIWYDFWITQHWH